MVSRSTDSNQWEDQVIPGKDNFEFDSQHKSFFLRKSLEV